MSHAVISYRDTEHQPTNTVLNLVHNPAFSQEDGFSLTSDCSIAQDQSHFLRKADHQTQFTHQTLVPSQDTNTITNADHHYNQTSPNTYNRISTKTVYYGCHHEPDLATSLTGLNLGGNFQVDTTSNPGLSVIIHPRWCSYCLRRREEEIRRHYNDRSVFPESANKDKARQERHHNEYRRGVIEGRIRGLRSPLSNTGQHTAGQYTSRLSNENGQPHTRDEVENQLVAMMGTQSLAHFDEGWNREQVEMEQFFQDHRHFRRGIKDGKKIQVQLESNALRIPDKNQREKFLENALM